MNVKRPAQPERGQAIIFFVGIFSVILIVAAIVIDFGLWWAERRSAQRVADLAAAAGAQDLPLNTQAAFQSACTWAAENGLSEAEVLVEIFKRGDEGAASPCGSSPPVPGCDSVCDTLRVRVSEAAPRLFTALPFLGVDGFQIGAVAAAGLTSGGGAAGTGPDQAIILMDVQRYSMSLGCHRHPTTCAMGRARTEAHEFVELVAGSSGALVGYVPYTHCYHPDMPSHYSCVDRSIVIDPTNNVDELHTAIDLTETISGGTANLCLPFLEAQRMFAQVPSGGKRTVTFVSDGDNRYNHSTYWNNILNYPPHACRPSPYDETFDDPSRYQACAAVPVPEERVLDLLTMQIATQLKNDGVEIYVVGLNVCSPNNIQQSPGYCAGIGNTDGDNIANQRLLKCVASSPAHYMSVDTEGLTGSFVEVAAEIVRRSLLQ